MKILGPNYLKRIMIQNHSPLVTPPLWIRNVPGLPGFEQGDHCHNLRWIKGEHPYFESQLAAFDRLCQEAVTKHPYGEHNTTLRSLLRHYRSSPDMTSSDPDAPTWCFCRVQCQCTDRLDYHRLYVVVLTLSAVLMGVESHMTRLRVTYGSTPILKLQKILHVV